MATFLPYASYYGNKPALQLMGMNRRSFSSFLGTPPCLRYHRRRRRAQPTTELTLMQLTQLIRVLRQRPYQSPVEEPEVGGGRVSAVTGASPSQNSKFFRSSCLLCVHNPHKEAG